MGEKKNIRVRTKYMFTVMRTMAAMRPEEVALDTSRS
jgi:hypothetical protein